jgi:hypothetical protein
MQAIRNDRSPSSPSRIKWSYATRIVPVLPHGMLELQASLTELVRAPRSCDVVVAEVVEIGQQRRIELRDGRKATLFVGDLIGAVHGFLNPTTTHPGAVPGARNPCLLHSGGLCGEFEAVAAGCDRVEPPTRLRPRGYLDFGAKDRSLEPNVLPATATDAGPRTIVVVGSGPESGKTTAGSCLVNGLVRAGYRVGFGKPCGVASQRDLGLMQDAGASLAIDFLAAGCPSTARCSPTEIDEIVDTVHARLCAQQPDFVVLEIADGLVQRESGFALRRLSARNLLHHALYAAHDTLCVREGIERLRALGAEAVTVSGRVTCSPLGLREAQEESEVPVLQPDELREQAGLGRIVGAAIVAGGMTRHRSAS